MTRQIADSELLNWIEKLREEIRGRHRAHEAILALAEKLGAQPPDCECLEAIEEAEALILLLQELYDYRQLNRKTKD